MNIKNWLYAVRDKGIIMVCLQYRLFKRKVHVFQPFVTLIIIDELDLKNTPAMNVERTSILGQYIKKWLSCISFHLSASIEIYSWGFF